MSGHMCTFSGVCKLLESLFVFLLWFYFLFELHTIWRVVIEDDGKGL
jgi:hypothetical protein